MYSGFKGSPKSHLKVVLRGAVARRFYVAFHSVDTEKIVDKAVGFACFVALLID